MNRLRILSRCLVPALLAAAPAIAAEKPLQPFSWRTATPESQGISTAKLAALTDEMAKRKTRAFLVIRNDRIVCEWYAPGQSAATKQGTASLAKALVGGLSLAVAITDDKISLDDKVAKFIPSWREDARKSGIAIRHLGSHTSGLADAEADQLPHEKLTGWQGDFWKQLDPPNDPFTISRDQTPLIFDPGEKIQYSNPGIAVMTWCVTASLRDTARKDIRTLLRERVMLPIGVADEEWSVGYGKTFLVDGLPLVAAWGGGSYTPRATARIGRLILREGDWDGQPLLSRQAVRAITGDAGLPGHCGMGWWSNAGGRYTRLPKDAVWGAGAGDQLLLVIPSLNLIMVRNGQTLEPGPGESPLRQDDVFTKFHDYRARILFEPLAEAVTDRSIKRSEAASSEAVESGASKELRPPYPPSPVITGIAWAPKETIIRKAKGGDNWPLTWAEDGHLYTAYGDGNGFDPFINEKLSMGFCRIEGDAGNFTGTNIRSASGETRGPGRAAKKASGILCIEGTLYLWTRNANNSQLAWSADHGATWQWLDWKFSQSFGCPTFLNFGQNYAGARDDYVYVYSPDNDSAYQPADRMVLARVSKSRIRQREAYEFLQRLDSAERPVWTRTGNALWKNGQRLDPVWTSNIDQRGAVFEHPGRCYRSGITYNAGLKRYLWVQILPGTQGTKADTRFEGGFAIYDAPEPWGPWTTVFITDKWDVGPGETASFPTKWMSADGRTLHFVFSGDDSFSVRQATLR